MAYQSSVKLNILQNQEDFKLEPVSQQSPLFKHELFKKTLDPPKDNLDNLSNYRTVTVTCLFKGCK
jgi:hypothetical protein